LRKNGISTLILAALVLITSTTVVDADLWGHLRFGLDVVESGKIAQADPYSYLSAGQRWINYEWLAEGMFVLTWTAAQETGLILLKTLVGVLALGLIYFYLNREIPPIRAGILVILAWAAIFPTIATVPPHMFALLFSGILFAIISLAESGKYSSGFLAGLGFLGIWTGVHSILQDWFDGGRVIDPNMRAIAIEMTGCDFEKRDHLPPKQQIANAVSVMYMITC
jgi:hypothetical protein